MQKVQVIVLKQRNNGGCLLYPALSEKVTKLVDLCEEEEEEGFHGASEINRRRVCSGLTRGGNKGSGLLAKWVLMMGSLLKIVF
ncbi:hypothetical protein L484_013687 [Morus notabilis]|uniref:Uncharacterized protein n=1 Tax=Morus notabilis TaxID=981085 RepID=W9QFN1_9ROSA|nr:hypothetical protein L484_013687 [Morus notabilis]